MSLKKATLLAAIGLVACTLFAVNFLFMLVVREANPKGRVVPRQEWPDAFSKLLNSAESRHIDVSSVRVQQWKHDEYFLVAERLPDLLDLMRQQWKLSPIPQDAEVIRRFPHRMPTKFVSTLDGNKCYASPNWLAGEKGDQFGVIENEADNLLVVRYYYNF